MSRRAHALWLIALSRLTSAADRRNLEEVDLVRIDVSVDVGRIDLQAVAEEFAAAGCPLLLLVVSPAIAASVIATSGTPEQKERWLPRFADGSVRMSFAITEPDAGSNSHRITTTARRDPEGGWRLSGRKYYISGVDEADLVKTDGEYLYAIAGGSLVITRAWPISEAAVLGQIGVDGHPRGV